MGLSFKEQNWWKWVVLGSISTRTPLSVFMGLPIFQSSLNALLDDPRDIRKLGALEGGGHTVASEYMVLGDLILVANLQLDTARVPSDVSTSPLHKGRFPSISIGGFLGPVFLLGLSAFAMVAACASRAAVKSAISCRRASKVMAGVSDVDGLWYNDEDEDNDANDGDGDERDISWFYEIRDNQYAGGVIGSGDEKDENTGGIILSVEFSEELKDLLPAEARNNPVPKSKTSCLNDNSSAIFESLATSCRHMEHLEGDVGSLYDELLRLKASLDVLFVPCYAAAEMSHQGGHVDSIWTKGKLKQVGKLLRRVKYLVMEVLAHGLSFKWVKMS
ncbi:hypothetical protein Tco_0789008 [Tanacetum coccineum]